MLIDREKVNAWRVRSYILKCQNTNMTHISRLTTAKIRKLFQKHLKNKNATKIINTYKEEAKSELRFWIVQEQTLCIYHSVETHSIHWFHIMMIQWNKTIDNTHWVETNEESWHVCVVLSVHWVASSLKKVDEMRSKFVSIVQSFLLVHITYLICWISLCEKIVKIKKTKFVFIKFLSYS